MFVWVGDTWTVEVDTTGEVGLGVEDGGVSLWTGGCGGVKVGEVQADRKQRINRILNSLNMVDLPQRLNRLEGYTEI
jgi:hypothetical protein